MAPAESLARLRKHVLDRVTRGGVTVATACREAGITRARYYQLRRRYLAYGEAGLRPKPHPARPTRQLSAPLVDAIVSYAIMHAGEGERSIAQALALSRYGAWRVSHGGVRNALRRAGLGRRLARLAAAEALSAAEGGPLTERALRAIRAIERPKVMHIGSDIVGAELSPTRCTWGSSKASARSGSTRWSMAPAAWASPGSAPGARVPSRWPASFGRTSPRCTARPRSGSSGLTPDGGPEFGRDFTRACLELGIEHYRLPPRSPDLNAFVERFQGTCLHLHYRTAFRYRYYTGATDIDADLAAWPRHYNFERPHRGYRTKGRRPAELFYAHRPSLLKMKGWDLNEFTLTPKAV